MADIRQNRKCRNYITAFVATYKTGQALENFTKQGLLSVHNHIKQAVGNLPPCLNHCSQHIQDTNRWCNTCTCWRIELENFLPRGIRRNWQSTKSWCWPTSEQEIAEVFILPEWRNRNINLKDISTIFNIWNRCLQFQRNIVNLLEPLKESRNELVHNTANIKLTNARKNEIFQQIDNVINHPDIQQTIQKHADFLQTLRELKSGKLFENDIKRFLEDIGMQNADIKAKLDALSLAVEDTNRVYALLGEMKRSIFLMGSCIIYCLICVLLAILCSQPYINQKCLGSKNYSLQSTLNVKNRMILSSQQECLPELSKIRHYPQISLMQYIDQHKNFVGRTWLSKLIERKLFVASDTNRGIILEAGMGYGKSAYLKQIICSSDNSSGSFLRSRLVAFHVCRFNVLASKEMFAFVFRLINMMSSQMLFINDSIKTCIDIFDKQMCKKDPYGCLDQCLILPLKDVSYTGSRPVIVIIDGLDECYDTSRGVNDILLLLKDRLYRFPSWVKFLVSSRPDKRLNHLKADLQIIKLKEDSRDNMGDIEMYVKYLNSNKSLSIPFKTELGNISNFLLISFLKNANGTKNYEAKDSFPRSLYEFYQHEFQRLFENDPIKQFKDSKIILEVISSSFKTLSRDTLRNILSNDTIFSLKRFNSSMQLLDNFFRKIGNEIHLFHLSFQDWLLSETNTDFSIDIENGHKLNAIYLFKQIGKGEFDIVDLVMHVHLSRSEDLQKHFLNIPKLAITKVEHDKDEQPLFRLVRRQDSFEAVNLLMSHFHDFEARNKDNVTALYLAASLGHLNTFSALIQKGANVSFRTDSFNKIINFENASLVSFEHQHWDYGVMDIAAQNGHINIVRYILENITSLFDYPMTKYNSMNLLPVHLACKKGHTNIVKLLHSSYKWMLDWQCLYYASEIGRLCLVKYLLDNKVQDRCRKCESHINWIDKSQLRVQGKYFVTNDSEDQHISYVLHDDWADITCESALHVAVREKMVDVVKNLTSQSNHSAYCYDRGGRTPVISAIQYGFQEIIEHFISAKILTGNETCAEIRPLNDSFKLHENEIVRLGMQNCENRISVPHILGKYNQAFLSELLTNRGIKLNWRSRDSDGCYPIHIAACHGSVEMLEFLFKEKQIEAENLECFNSSTPLQSAVECRSVKSTEFFLLNFQKYHSESNDIKFKYVKAAMKTNYGTELALHYENIEESVSKMISLLITNDSAVTVTDEMGRNILHYAIEQGHYKVVDYLFNHHLEESKILLRSDDNYNRNPLLYALFELKPLSCFYLSPPFFGDHIIHLNGSLNRMTPKEYSLLLTLNFMKQSNMLLTFQDLFEHFVKKQCIHVVKFLLETNYFLLEDPATLSRIIEHDRHGLQALAFYLTSIKREISGIVPNLPLNSRFSCFTCYGLIYKCQTHKIALNYLKISSLIHLFRLDKLNDVIQRYVFRKSLSPLMSNCYDSDGFNVLERAIQSGSPELVRYLTDTGVKSDLDKHRLIEMALNGLKYRQENEYIPDIAVTDLGVFKISYLRYEAVLHSFNSKEHHDLRTFLSGLNVKLIKEDLNGLLSMKRSVLDDLVSNLIIAYRYDIPKQKICLKVCKKFSIIHRLAFEGLKNSIRLVIKFWGKHILNCKNIDDFTPLYLSKVFQYEETTNFIEAQGISFKAPSKTAEMYFYFKLLFRYTFTGHKEKQMLCILSYPKTVPSTTYQKIKAYKCSKKVVYFIRSKEYLKIINVLKWKLSYLIEQKTWRSLINRTMNLVGKAYIKSWEKHKLIAMHILENIKTTFKTVDKNNVLNDMTLANLIQIADAENRTCNYLRISAEKITLILKDEASRCTHNCSPINMILQRLNVILENFAKHRWSSSNCSDVDSDSTHFCLKRKEQRDFSIFVKRTFHRLRVNILSNVVKKAYNVPFSAERANFSEMIQNPDAWLRRYHCYNYMNEFQTSPIFKESFAYNSKTIHSFTRYIEKIGNRLKFFEWKSNAEKLFEQFLTSKERL